MSENGYRRDQHYVLPMNRYLLGFIKYNKDMLVVICNYLITYLNNTNVLSVFLTMRIF